jgi:hypothetical protein
MIYVFIAKNLVKSIGSIIQFYIFPQLPDFSRTGRRFSDSVRGKPISSAVFKVRSRPGRSFCASSNLSIPNKRGKPITEQREGEVRERNGVTKSEAIGSSRSARAAVALGHKVLHTVLTTQKEVLLI